MSITQEVLIKFPEQSLAAKYQEREVLLNKPFRTPGKNKKFGVYTKNEKGNVVLIRFGDPNLSIKRDDPTRRKSFRARHRCDSAPPDRWTARYWSCYQWRAGAKVIGSNDENLPLEEELFKNYAKPEHSEEIIEEACDCCED